jgi:hypothetical protein
VGFEILLRKFGDERIFRSRFFVHFLRGKYHRENSAESFPPKNVGKKMEFSAEKVLKNRFGIFRGK